MIEIFVAGDFLEQLRTANQQIAGEPAGVESFDHQLEQSRVGGQQFKKQAAQTVSFDEANELIQDGIRVRCLCHLLEKGGSQFCKNLFRARRHVGRRGGFQQIRKRSGRGFFVFKQFQIWQRTFGRGGQDDPIENRSNILHRLLESGAEFVGRIKSETSREPGESHRIARSGVSLLFRFNLQPVLDLAEEAISAIKIDHFFLRDQFEFREGTQRLHGACFLQESVAAAGNELERLDNEFDFTNSATPELNVPVQFVCSQGFAFYPAFDFCDFIEQIRGRAARINERLMLAQEFVGQFATACDPSRFD